MNTGNEYANLENGNVLIYTLKSIYWLMVKTSA